MLWQWLGQLTLILAAAFTGAAIFVNVAEQPARLALSDRASLVQWQVSYRRAAPMQAGLALVTAALAFWVARETHDVRWIIGAVIILTNWPYTLIVIKPLNDRLHSIGPEKADMRSHRLIRRWGKLHAVRTAFGAIATLIFLWAIVA